MALCNNEAKAFITTCDFIPSEKQKTLGSICDGMKIEKKEDLRRLTAENVSEILTKRELEELLENVEKETTSSSYCHGATAINALIHATGKANIGDVSFSNSAIASGPNAKAMYAETKEEETSQLYKPLVDAKIPPMMVKDIIRKLKKPPFQIEYLDDFKEMDDKDMAKLESNILPEGAQRKKFMRFVREYVKEKSN